MSGNTAMSAPDGEASPTPGIVVYLDPPPPTSQGACCLESTCIIDDYFDCMLGQGNFLPGVAACFPETCGTGVCCLGDASCLDNDGVGRPMDQSVCAAQGGNYMGAAACDDTDPCTRFRIPSGFEIVEAAPGTEMQERRHPRMNNCGQIVFHMMDSTGNLPDIYLADNGVLSKVTDDNVWDWFPDINDLGTIAWDRVGLLESVVVRERGGVTTTLDTHDSLGAPAINNLGHVGWSVPTPDGCVLSAFKADVAFYDGRSSAIVFADGLSNQSVRINDNDELTWTRFRFPCGGGFGDWTSSILLRTGSATFLPSASANPQLPYIDDGPRVAWDGSPVGLELWADGQTTLLVAANTSTPSINAAGDIAFIFKTPQTPWQAKVIRGGTQYDVSSPLELATIVQLNPALNDNGEIAWWWNYGFQGTPSGIRYMRRIRNGDVNFDGSVTMEDFIPFPGCFTNGEKRDGLCECRFYDIDHDRDIDDDDFALFMRVYTGPLDDCNGNGTSDLVELLHAQAEDADLNGIIDACEVASNAALDADGDGMIDAACVPVAPSAPWASSGLTASAAGGGPLPDGRGTEEERRSDEATERRRDGEAEEPVAGARGAEGPVAGARGSVQSTIDNRQSTIPSRESPIANRPSTIPSRQSAIGNRQSAITAAPTGRYLSFTVDPGIPPTMNRPAFALDPAAGGWPTEPPYLSTRKYRFQGTSGIPRMAVKVNFVMLPGAYNIYDGTSAWVDTPRPVSELPGKDFNDPVGTDRTFLAARLTDHPVYADFATMGTVYVYDERIVPSRRLPGQALEPAVYSVQTVIEGCGLATDLNLSPALDVINARWADVAYLVDGQFAAPDGQVSIDDTLAALAKFGAATGAPTKPRADLLGQGAAGSTGAVDGKIDISDIIATLNAFAGAEYPYPPPG